MSSEHSRCVGRLLVVGVLFIGATHPNLPIVVADDTDESPPATMLLFDSGREGYPRYRIPALIVGPNGDVLAFCEGRVDGGGFQGNIDLVLKRSADSGQTWGPLQTIADGGPHTFGYPVRFGWCSPAAAATTPKQKSSMAPAARPRACS
jgi:sialidase-1